MQIRPFCRMHKNILCQGKSKLRIAVFQLAHLQGIDHYDKIVLSGSLCLLLNLFCELISMHNEPDFDKYLFFGAGSRLDGVVP